MMPTVMVGLMIDGDGGVCDLGDSGDAVMMVLLFCFVLCEFVLTTTMHLHDLFNEDAFVS